MTKIDLNECYRMFDKMGYRTLNESQDSKSYHQARNYIREVLENADVANIEEGVSDVVAYLRQNFPLLKDDRSGGKYMLGVVKWTEGYWYPWLLHKNQGMVCDYIGKVKSVINKILWVLCNDPELYKGYDRSFNGKEMEEVVEGLSGRLEANDDEHVEIATPNGYRAILIRNQKELQSFNVGSWCIEYTDVYDDNYYDDFEDAYMILLLAPDWEKRKSPQVTDEDGHAVDWRDMTPSEYCEMLGIEKLAEDPYATSAIMCADGVAYSRCNLIDEDVKDKHLTLLDLSQIVGMSYDDICYELENKMEEKYNFQTVNN